MCGDSCSILASSPHFISKPLIFKLNLGIDSLERVSFSFQLLHAGTRFVVVGPVSQICLRDRLVFLSAWIYFLCGYRDGKRSNGNTSNNNGDDDSEVKHATTGILAASVEEHAVSCVINDLGSVSSCGLGDLGAFSEVIMSDRFWGLIEKDLVMVKQKFTNCCEKMITSSALGCVLFYDMALEQSISLLGGCQ